MPKNDTSHKLILVAPLARITRTRDQSFFYTAPSDTEIAIGDRVRISFGRRTIDGIVTDTAPSPARSGGMTLKPVLDTVEPRALTRQQIALATTLAERYLCPLGIVLPLLVHDPTHARTPENPSTLPTVSPLTLSPGARDVCTALAASDERDLVLDTGGSTESTALLLSLIETLLTRDPSGAEQILILVSERTQLTPLTQALADTFPGDTYAVLHTSLSGGARTRAHRRIASGDAQIVIGTRGAIFAPFAQLSHMILWQSHDMAYKQWKAHPYYDVRAIAPDMAQIYGAQIIRMSDAPRIIDWHRARETGTLFQLPESGPRRIQIINMREAYWKHNEKRRQKTKPLLSEELLHTLRTTLSAGGTALLLINRQGKNAFSVCTKCAHVLMCPACERALVEKRSGHYACLHCTYKSDAFPACAHCGNLAFRPVGTGTESITEEIERTISDARVARIDADTLTSVTTAEKFYHAVRAGTYNVIVGTQMITKSVWHDNITHVAILDMDTLLGSIDYDAHEKALAHVSTLYSRCIPGGTLSIQVYDLTHPVLDHARAIAASRSLSARVAFLEEDLAMRQILRFPPASSLIRLTHKHRDQKAATQNADDVYDALMTRADENTIVSDPHAPLIARHRGMHHIQIIIKYQNTPPPDLHYYLGTLDRTWTINVDPESIT